MRKPYDTVSGIIEFENGEMDESQVSELFQHLLDSGMIYSLQGSHQRTAQSLLDAGLIHPPKSTREARA